MLKLNYEYLFRIVMNKKIQAVKGTIDFYPEDMALRTWLYNQMRSVSELFGYQEYEAPILETLALYAAKSGEEIVEKQSYVFTDRSGDRITLRPELTPSLARMVAAKQAQLVFPLRWWSFGPFWRYERPQKGRTREFFQWNIDLIGEPTPEADAELIIIAATFLILVGLVPGEFKIKVNNRHLMNEELAALEAMNVDNRLIFQLIDKKDKLSIEKWFGYAKEIGLSTQQTSQLENILKDPNLWKKSAYLKRIFEIVETVGLSNVIEYSPNIIRGLQYYTGTVFEAWDTQGEFRALFGGGRYDNLVSEVGGQPVGGVGFAAGDKVLSLLLKKLNRLPDFSQSSADVFITLFNDELYLPTLKLAQSLRKKGIKVLAHNKAEKLGKQFKYADRLGVKISIVMGPDEYSESKATLKNMETGKQLVVLQSDLYKTIREVLEDENSS